MSGSESKGFFGARILCVVGRRIEAGGLNGTGQHQVRLGVRTVVWNINAVRASAETACRGLRHSARGGVYISWSLNVFVMVGPSRIGRGRLQTERKPRQYQHNKEQEGRKGALRESRNSYRWNTAQIWKLLGSEDGGLCHPDRRRIRTDCCLKAQLTGNKVHGTQ